MRNKGAILTLAIALAVVCIYQLSFTWKAVSVRNQAKEFAKVAGTDSIDSKLEQYFIDSVSSEKTYLFKLFSYRDIQEKELNFGLDLKGGMNIILEISVTDVIRNLSSNPADTTLNKALALARKMEQNSSEDFIVLFGKAFEQVAPGVSMESLFRTKDLSTQIPFGATNAQVMAVLEEKTSGAINNAFNIISTRINQFGVAQPNIQQLEQAGRIMVDLPGVKDKDRVRKLLQGTANLEFWEVYENTPDVQNILLAINDVVKATIDVEKAKAEEGGEKANTDTAELMTQPQAAPEGLELLDQIAGDSTASSDSALMANDVNAQYPFFQLLQPYPIRDTKETPGPVIGLAHFKDTARVNSYLKLAAERNIVPRDMRFMWSAKPMADQDKKSTNAFELYAVKITGRDGKAPLDGDAVTNARMEMDPVHGNAYVSMSMNAEGATAWARLTAQNVEQCIAIVMDNMVFSAPVVQNEIKGGNSQITGNFTQAEATDLANLLESGKLPAPARIIEENVVGPTLGKEAINAGQVAFIIAFILVLVYMAFYYKSAGYVADVALVTNMFFIFGVLASLGAALTLPGIAGIVLTLGMAVDANVIIYERIREELRAGKGLRLAITDGYKNAYSAIIDGNITTLLAGIILYIFGKGPIQGFATTLIIGILTSLFTAIFVSRIIFENMLSKQKDVKFSRPLTANVLLNAKVDFIGMRKIFYVISAIIIGTGVYSMFTGGFNLGIDFKGGYNYVVRFDQDAQVNTVDLSKNLSEIFDQTVEVKTFGNVGNQVKISTKAIVLEDDAVNVDSLVEAKLFAGLQPLLKEGTTLDSFEENNMMSSQKVGPTISDDIRKSAVWSIVFSLLGIFLYIFMRFRNWRFGFGGVVSLAHDTLFVLGMYSLLRNIMPFSMEIDQSFIAAILTVIGYSINDTVIIYDRIREYRTIHPKYELRDIFNLAMNSTLGRTMNTSLTTLLTLFVMFVYGGEVIRGFIFALLIGIGIGTYSSVFSAAPIVFDMLKVKIGKSKK
ncbi:MAG: protein translocase subunit SecDF [Bacteroidales bacterium]|nr:protein translocase subunit SecDF [Bacteroidales bacterium]